MLLRGMKPWTFATALRAGFRSLPHFRHLFFCIADHFEPNWGGADKSLQQARVSRWVECYPNSICGLHDSRGRSPQHTFFYPIEVYDPHHMDPIAGLVHSGMGDVEIHLHHDQATEQQLTDQLLQATDCLHLRHGLLSRDKQGIVRYGFIHGNWALDNSHPDGHWCGVNNELTILRQTGCYADFTMPAAPHAAQTRTINSLYYAVDDPLRPKSHDTGIAAQVGVIPPQDGLLMIQGPLVVSNPFVGRVVLENGNIAGSQPPSLGRLQNWLRAGVCVRGQPDWLFIKLHTHGATEKNSAVLLGPAMRQFHQDLNRLAQQQPFQYYYVTAREMAGLIHQAEAGHTQPDFDSLA
jgi:hypothetical protein